jgi:hypothetical protein
VEGGALEVTLLSQEQLQSLSLAAIVLRKGMEEVTRAARKKKPITVQERTDCTTVAGTVAVVAVQGLPPATEVA